MKLLFSVIIVVIVSVIYLVIMRSLSIPSAAGMILTIIAAYVFPQDTNAQVPSLGACKKSETVSEKVKVTEGVQFSPSGFWYQMKDDDKPFDRGEAVSAGGRQFLALFRNCRQGMIAKECYYVWAGELPRRRGLKIDLTMVRDEENCVEVYSQADVDAYLVQKKEEERRVARIEELRRQEENKSKVFNDECIFHVMPPSPNQLISDSVSQLCGYLAERFAKSGLIGVRLFVIKGDSLSSRLVCYVSDSWGRSEPAFLDSVSNRCNRFAEEGGNSFIQNYPLSDIPNLDAVLESSVVNQSND